MATLTIPQKMSNTGSIHDVRSSEVEREINFPDGHEYAVVLASYYGGKGYTTHATEEEAIKASNEQKEYSHLIIDRSGRVMDKYGDTLVLAHAEIR